MELISVHRSLLISLFALLSLFDLYVVYLGYLDMVYLGTVDLLPPVVALTKTRLHPLSFYAFLQQVTQRAKF